jgi:hypothetical protein
MCGVSLTALRRAGIRCMNSNLYDTASRDYVPDVVLLFVVNDKFPGVDRGAI